MSNEPTYQCPHDNCDAHFHTKEEYRAHIKKQELEMYREYQLFRLVEIVRQGSKTTREFYKAYREMVKKEDQRRVRSRGS